MGAGESSLVSSGGGGPKVGDSPDSAFPMHPPHAAGKIRYPEIQIEIPGKKAPNSSSKPQNSTANLEHANPPQIPEATEGEHETEGLISRFSKGKLKKFDSETNLLLGVSALIITLSFAAVLQPPGGINTSEASPGAPTATPPRRIGQANLVGESVPFWVFFIANGSAMAAASLAILILISCPPRKDSQAFYIIVVGKILVWLAIQSSLAAFCAAVWIIVGREKSKVAPFFIAAGMLYLCFTTFFICGRMVRATARKAKIKFNKRHSGKHRARKLYGRLVPQRAPV